MKRYLIAVLWISFVVIISYAIQNSYYPMEFFEEVKLYSKKYNVEADLIYAIIKSESDFDSNQISNKDAVGLMQVLPSTASFIMDKVVTTENLKDTKTNIEVGTKYLSYLLNKFESLNSVICAYNAGEGNVRKWLQDKKYSKDGINLISTPFKSTNAYLEKVLHSKEIYKKKLKIYI